VVEDEDAVRDLVVRILERHGYTTRAADRGQLALDLAREHPPELLVTDVIMPQMSGQELAQRLREHQPGMPVVFVTGYSDGLLGTGELSEPGTHLIQKPFTTDELLDVVHRALHTVPAGPA
jgi:CheY-like chemotaxis protein